MLQRVDSIPAHIDILQIKKALGEHDRIDTLISNKLLYMVDYSELLASVKGGQVNVFGMPEPIKKYIQPVHFIVRSTLRNTLI